MQSATWIGGDSQIYSPPSHLTEMVMTQEKPPSDLLDIQVITIFVPVSDGPRLSKTWASPTVPSSGPPCRQCPAKSVKIFNLENTTESLLNASKHHSFCISISVLQDKNGQKRCISQHHKPRTKTVGLWIVPKPPRPFKGRLWPAVASEKRALSCQCVEFLKDGFWVGFSWTFGFWLLLMFSAWWSTASRHEMTKRTLY